MSRVSVRINDEVNSCYQTHRVVNEPLVLSRIIGVPWSIGVTNLGNTTIVIRVIVDQQVLPGPQASQEGEFISLEPQRYKVWDLLSQPLRLEGAIMIQVYEDSSARNEPPQREKAQLRESVFIPYLA